MKKIFTSPTPVKNTFSTNEKGISSDAEQPEPQKMRSRVEFKMKRLGAMRANQWQWFQLSGKSKSNERAKQRWKLLRNTLLAIRIRCNRNLKVTSWGSLR